MDGIVFAGLMAVDNIKIIEKLPSRGELTKIMTIKKSTGGSVCNTGIDFAVLDKTIPVKAMGVIGTDENAKIILDNLERHEMDTSKIIRRGDTSFTDVFAETKYPARTFYQFGGSSVTFCEEDIDLKNLDCKIFHIGYLLLLDKLDGEDLEYGTKMARLLHDIQSKGIKTSIDVVTENSDRFQKIVTPALKYVDYLIINEIEAGKITNLTLRSENEELISDNIPKAIEKLFACGVKDTVIIHYPEGSCGMKKNGKLTYTPSNKLPEGYIKGTVGAGDAFCAGSLLALYNGYDMDKILDYGNASAQVSLTSDSATGGMVNINDALKEYQKLRK